MTEIRHFRHPVVGNAWGMGPRSLRPRQGRPTLPQTITPARMAQNVDLGFEISAADLAILDQLTDTAIHHYGSPRRD